jgi:hypothetical protein
MHRVTLELRPDTEQRLQTKARLRGLSLESYLQQLAEREAADKETAERPTDGVSLADFERQLDELSAGLPPLRTLPADFARADLYGEHD